MFICSLVTYSSFTDPQSLQAWNQRLATLSDEERAFFLENSRGDVQKFSQAIKLACTKARKESLANKINSLLRPFCRTLGMYMPGISAASQADPYPSSLVVGGIVGLLQMSDNFDAYQSGIADWLNKLGEKAGILMDYDLCVYQYDPRVQRALVGIYGDILRFCQKAYKIYIKEDGERRNGAWIFAKSLMKKFQDEFGEITQSFENHLDNYKEVALQSNTKHIQECLRHLRSLENEQRQASQQILFRQEHHFQVQEAYLRTNLMRSQAILEGQRQILSSRSEERQLWNEPSNRIEERPHTRQMILDWLTSIDFVNDKDERREHLSLGSGEWVLSHHMYTKWKDAVKSDVLWITGKPGSGKSVLSTVVSDELSNIKVNSSERPVIEFLCKASVPDRSNYKVILTHFLREAVLHRQQVVPEIESLYEREGALGRKPSVRDLEQTLPDAFSAFSNIYLVIDGLDELEEKDRLTLLKFLSAAMTKTRSFLKIIIFSKHFVLEHKILAEYDNLRIDGGANGSDIENYISRKLAEMNPDWEEGLEDMVKAMLLKRADGMFLYVRLMVNRLAGDLTKDEIVQRLLSLPKDLRAAYEANLKRILTQADEEDGRLICRILLWLANARRPLKKEELLEALSVEIGASYIKDSERRRTDRDFTKRCAELVKVQEDGCYHLIHESLRDYLVDLKDGMPQEVQLYCRMQSQAGRTLGNTCLTYLLLSQFEGTHFEAPEELKSLKEKNPFLDYAAKFWGTHLQHTIDSDYGDLYRTFLNSKHTFSLSIQVLFFEDEEAPSPESFTRLHMLAYFGLTELATLEQNLKTLRRDVDSVGFTPLDWALRNQKVDMSMWLLSSDFASGSDCTSLARRYSVMHFAVILRSTELLTFALEKNFDVNARGAKDGYTPLMLAAEFGFDELVQILLRHGSDPNIVAARGKNALMVATERANYGLASSLIARTSDLDVQDSDGLSALHFAASNGNLEIVTCLLQRGARLLNTSVADWSRTPLHNAVEGDHVNVVRELLEYDGNSEVCCEAGFRPIHLAAMNNSSKAAKLLLQRGADLNTRTQNGRHALHLAACNGNNEFIEDLLQGQDDVNIVDDDRSYTPLHYAASRGHLSVCVLLLKRGADVNALDSKNQTPFHLSISEGFTEVAKLLLTWNSSPAMPGKAGALALHYAAKSGMWELIRPLLSAGADPMACQDAGKTALHIAATKKQTRFIDELFLSVDELPVTYTVDPNPFDNRHRTPLHRAAQKGTLEVIAILQEKGAKIDLIDDSSNHAIHYTAYHGSLSVFNHLFSEKFLNLRGYYGRTLLCSSVLMGHKEIALRLLDLNADTEIADEGGNTPLLVAAGRCNEELCYTLIERGANPHVSSPMGDTLLHLASENGDLDLIKFLIKSNCDPNAINVRGETPFLCSVWSNKLEIVEYYLENAGVNVNQEDRAKCRPIHGAASIGNLAIITTLVKAGADVRARDSAGQDALTHAAHHGAHWLVRPLILLGLDVNGAPNSSFTPLYEACERGYAQFVDRLIENGVDVNHHFKINGQSPLHVATINRRTSIIRRLVAWGADKLKKDHCGLTPLDYARSHKACMKALGEVMSEERALINDDLACGLWNALRQNLTNLIALDTKEDFESQNQRLASLGIITTCFKNLKAPALLPHIKIIYRRMGSASKLQHFRISFKCDLCWKSSPESVFSFCADCLEVFLCPQCLANYEKGWKMAKSAPHGFLRLVELEDSARSFRLNIMKKLRILGVKGVSIIIELSPIARKFVSKRVEEYQKWDEEYYGSDYHTERKPGYVLLKILGEAQQLMQKGRPQDNSWEKEWARLQVECLNARRICDVDVDDPGFRCSGHTYIEVPDKESFGEAEGGSPFESDGNLKTKWLEAVLEACPCPPKTWNDQMFEDKSRERDTDAIAFNHQKHPKQFAEPSIASHGHGATPEGVDSTTQKDLRSKTVDRTDVKGPPISNENVNVWSAQASGGLNMTENLTRRIPTVPVPKETDSVRASLRSMTSDIRRTVVETLELSEIMTDGTRQRKGSLPSQTIAKSDLLRRSTAPLSTYLEQEVIGGARVPVASFELLDSSSDEEQADQLITEEPEVMERVTSRPKEEDKGEENSFNTKIAQKKPQTLIADLHHTTTTGWYTLQSLEVAETIEPGSTRQFIHRLLSDGSADDFGLELVIAVLDHDAATKERRTGTDESDLDIESGEKGISFKIHVTEDSEAS